MRRLSIILALFLAASTAASAKEYGTYDLKRLAVADTAEGDRRACDTAYLDLILDDLALHARNYPATFDAPQDRERAVRDVAVVSNMLDRLVAGPNPDPELLRRAALVNFMGRNLEIIGSGEKADAAFRKLLAVAPADPRGNYLYGMFLAGSGKPKDALPYLEKARSLGIGDAAYSIGMVHFALGNKDKALESLKAYKLSHASDTTIDIIIEGISSGKLKLDYDMGAKGN